MPNYRVEFTLHGNDLVHVLGRVFSFAEEHGGASVSRVLVEEEK